MKNLVLLAAGRGSRLKNMTTNKPKPLLNYRGKSLIERIIQLGIDNGFKRDRIFIVAGYRASEFLQLGYPVLVNESWESTGPYRSLLTANEILQESDSVVSYTDVLYGARFLREALKATSDIFIPSNALFLESWENRSIDPLQDLETFRISEDKLIEIGNKPNNLKDIEGQFAGILSLTTKGWLDLQAIGTLSNNEKLDITTLLSLALDKDFQIKTKHVYDYWKEFDEISDFEF